MSQLSLAAQAARSDAGALLQIRQQRAGMGNQAIANVVAGQREKCNRPAFPWECLSRCDCKIDSFLKQRIFQFLDEYSLPADLRQGLLVQFVAEVLMMMISAFNAGQLEKLLAHKFGLPAGQNAASSADNEGASRFLPIR